MAGTYGKTTNFLLRFIKGTSKVSDLDEASQLLAEDVDTKMLGYEQDTFAKRPAAGRANALFRATDTGLLYKDNGATWEPVIGPALGAYSALTARVATTEYEPSASRPTMVVCSASCASSKGGEIKIFVGAVQVGVLVLYQANPAEATFTAGTGTVTFIVPPGVKWHFTQSGASIEVRSSYLTL